MSTELKFLLVDDEKLIREGVKALLQNEPFQSKIFEAGSKPEVFLAPLKELDIILLDFRLRDCNALELIPKLKSMTDARIIVVTGFEGAELVVNLLRTGVHSIIHKLDGYHEIRTAIEEVLTQGTYYPKHILDIIHSRAHEWDEIPPVSLTYSEKEMLVSICSGLTTKQIAGQLKMTEATTETYRLRLIKKLGVPNTAALLAYAFRNGIL